MAVAGDLLGAGGAAGGVEDLDGLGEAADPGQGRYLLAAQPVRVAGTVPALVEARMARAVPSGKPREREISAPARTGS